MTQPILSLQSPHLSHTSSSLVENLSLPHREIYFQFKETLEIIKQQYSQPVQSWAEDGRVLLRFLVGVRWDMATALKRIQATLRWREEYKPHAIQPVEVVEETKTGKIFIHGFDRDRNPILIMIPARENSKNYELQLKHVVFYLETVMKLMPPDVHSLTLIIDYENVSIMNSPPLSVVKNFITIVSDHYPEVLNKSFIMNPTWYIHVVLKFVTPFMDPITRSKIHLVNAKEARKASETGESDAIVPSGTSNPLNFINPDQLLDVYGGKSTFQWDFDVYWNALLKRIDQEDST